MKKSHEKSACNPRKNNKKNKTDPFFNIAFTNIRSLQSNELEVAAYLNNKKPDLFFLCETGLIPDNFRIPGYSLPISKPDPKQRHGHGLLAFIRDNFPCGRVAKYEDPSMPFLCFRLALVQGTSFIFALYRPCDDGVEMMDKIAEMIDSIMSDYPFLLFICVEISMFTIKSGFNQTLMILKVNISTTSVIPMI